MSPNTSQRKSQIVLSFRPSLIQSFADPPNDGTEVDEMTEMMFRQTLWSVELSVDPSQMYERLPNELWMAIFDRLSLPRDLLHCLLTCKRFYSIAWPCLHRTVFITTSAAGALRRTLDSLSNLPENTPLRHVAKGMVVGHLQGYLKLKRLMDPYYGIESIIQKSFVESLTNLTFVGATLPSTIVPALAKLANLQRLYLYSSYIHYKVDQDTDSEDESEGVGYIEEAKSHLPVLRQLKEFRLWRHDWYGITSETDYKYTLKELLHVCKRMHALCIDWNTVVAPTLNRAVQRSTLPWRYLCLRMPPLDMQIINFRMSGEPLLQLLPWLDHLEELRIVGNCFGLEHMDQELGVVRVSQLRTYSGPFELFATFAEVPALERINFTFTKDPRPHHNTLGKIYTVFSRLLLPRLEALSFYVDKWDGELLSFLVSKFPKLKELRIAYADGVVTEDELSLLASVYLVSLPQLRVFHLYHLAQPTDMKLSAPTQGGRRRRHNMSQQENTRHLLHAYLQGKLSIAVVEPKRRKSLPDTSDVVLNLWSQYTPLLTEGRLTRTGVWTRGRQVDGEWTSWRMRPVSPLEDDSFVYNDDLERWMEFESLR
ncbi:hypothetical protein Moror_5512 [Moniliophthora roreri MCA 2997]|uniref:F-box domain-containing protein n=1 Tax=Moniliophthora roreri (strain MCA 2997) TaxID=1381753 RepID=V2Y964_MONRO|nr:hypothetical protein Moror_5512 [Moniliophthora roreri MCA 2997]